MFSLNNLARKGLRNVGMASGFTLLSAEYLRDDVIGWLIKVTLSS